MIREPGITTESYGAALAEYFTTRSETALYHASLLGQTCVESELGPEEIIALHTDALEASIAGLSYRQRAGAAVDALQFLLEVMIAYGVHHRRYLELRLQEQHRAAQEAAAQEQRRAQALEAADRVKGEVMGMIAHELRTPITAVRGYLDMATRALERAQAAQLPDLLAAARRSLDRLTRLTSDLTEASRGTVPPLDLEPVDLVVLLAEASAWAQPLAAEQGVNFVGNPAVDRLVVRGDPTALTTVVTNLLTNAIRYTPAGGQIIVRTEQTAGEAIIEVHDTGIGMPPDVQAHIFEKFYRSAEARAVEAQGLGIGLFLTRELVRAHGGEISVTSTVGVGSSFQVRLPLLAASPEEDAHG